MNLKKLFFISALTFLCGAAANADCGWKLDALTGANVYVCTSGGAGSCGYVVDQSSGTYVYVCQ